MALKASSLILFPCIWPFCSTSTLQAASSLRAFAHPVSCAWMLFFNTCPSGLCFDVLHQKLPQSPPKTAPSFILCPFTQTYFFTTLSTCVNWVLSYIPISFCFLFCFAIYPFLIVCFHSLKNKLRESKPSVLFTASNGAQHRSGP